MSLYAKIPGDGDENLQSEIERDTQQNGEDWILEADQETSFFPEENNGTENIRLEDVYVNNWHADEFNEVQPATTEKPVYKSSARRNFPGPLGNSNPVETETNQEPDTRQWDQWDWQFESLSPRRRIMYRLSSLAKKLFGVGNSESWLEDNETSRYCGMISLLLLLAFVVLGLPVVLHKLSPEAPELPGKNIRLLRGLNF